MGRGDDTLILISLEWNAQLCFPLNSLNPKQFNLNQESRKFYEDFGGKSTVCGNGSISELILEEGFRVTNFSLPLRQTKNTLREMEMSEFVTVSKQKHS